jgi:hypothetical protein
MKAVFVTAALALVAAEFVVGLAGMIDPAETAAALARLMS